MMNNANVDKSDSGWRTKLSKPAQALGVLRFLSRKWTGRTPTLIEYKGAEDAGS